VTELSDGVWIALVSGSAFDFAIRICISMYFSFYSHILIISTEASHILLEYRRSDSSTADFTIQLFHTFI
jgi:hypothetical protein